MQLASQQFLRAVRGKRSQVAFARKLGYSGNPIADWEAGRRSPTVAEALRACRLSGVDPLKAFERFQSVGGLGESLELGSWLASLAGATSAAELARRSGASRHQIRRWLTGAALPRVPDFLRLVNSITGRVCDLVAELVPIKQVPTLESSTPAKTSGTQSSA